MPLKSSLASRLAAREKKKLQSFDSFGDEDDQNEAVMNQLTSATQIGDNLPSTTTTTTKTSSQQKQITGASLRKQQSKLQKRGPLSEAFSTGKYAARARGDEEEEDHHDMDGQEEDFDNYSNDDVDEDDFPVKSKRGSKKAAAATSKKSKRSVGFAAAENEEEIEGKLEDVDDIFGILDAGSDDDDIIAGAENEEEVAERIEMKKRDPSMRARKVKRAEQQQQQEDLMYEDDEDEARHLEKAKDEDRDILQQIADLRKRQTEEKSGVAVEESVSVADQLRQAAAFLGTTHTALLRLRLRLQSAISNSIQLPQHYALQDFVGAKNGNEEVKSAYQSLRQQMSSTFIDVLNATCGGNAHKIIVENENEERDNGNNNNNSDDADAEVEVANIDIDASYDNYVRLVDAPARRKIDATIEAIGKRVVLGPTAQKAKSDKVSDVPILDQIRGVMTGLTRLYTRAQKNRAHVEVFGHPLHYLAGEAAEQQQQNSTSRSGNDFNSNNNNGGDIKLYKDAAIERKKDIALGDIDEEVFDDSDFARELIQRSAGGSNSSSRGGTNSGAGSMITQSELQQQLKQSTNKTTKKGFHRKTKGRSVSYDPRPKLVGFMVPVPFTQEEHQREALFKNVFADP